MNIITQTLNAGKVGTSSSLLLPNLTSPAPATNLRKVKRGTPVGDAYRQNAKAKADIVAKLKAIDLFTRAEGELLELCGKDFITTMSNKCGKILDTYPAFRCGLAYCPDCNIRRRNRELKSVKPKFDEVLRDNPALRPYFLTLTLRDRMTQAAANKYLKKQFAKLRRQKFFTAKGGYYRIEFTVVADGWNAHIHAVILSEKNIAESQISKAWSELTRGSYIVDIRPIEIDELDTVLGYAFKPADFKEMTKEQVLEMISSSAQRTGESFGIVRRSKAEPATETDTPAKPKVGDKCDCGDPDCRIVQVVFTRDELITLLDYQTPLAVPLPRAKPRYVH